MPAHLHFFLPAALGHTAHADTVEPAAQGEVDIEAGKGLHVQVEGLLYQPRQVGAEGCEVGLLTEVAEREGHSGQALQRPLGGDAHGAGIVGVDGGVVAMVDAADDHIGPPLGQHVEGQFDAIDGRPRAGIDAQAGLAADLAVAQGLRRGDGATIAGARTVGRHHQQIGHRAKGLDEELQAGGADPVIVGEKKVGTFHEE